MNYREEVRRSDLHRVRELIESSEFFSSEEVEVAVELVEERLSKGARSGYHFLFAEEAGKVIAYSCFGPIACTRGSYDLYWIAVDNERRGAGIGSEILRRSEAAIARLGGSRIYVETSSRKQYEPTHAFYLRNGYREVAVLEDFYFPGDDKIIYLKILPGQ
jgi:ribosomal protein S18 acetylase RimI-like enzyme